MNRSTSESVFVWQVGVGGTGTNASGAARGAFSFPLRLAKAFRNPSLIAVSFPHDGPAVGIIGCCVACNLNLAVARWKLLCSW